MVKTTKVLNWSKWTILFSLLIFVGCNADEYDMNKFAGVDQGWNPKFEVPIGSGSYELWDLIEAANEDGDTLFMRDPKDDLIHIIYSEDSIFTYDAAEMVEIPSEQGMDPLTVAVGEIDLDDIKVHGEVTMKNLIDSIPQLNIFSGAEDGSTTNVFPAFSSGEGGSYHFDGIDTYNKIELSQGKLAFTFTNNLPLKINELTLKVIDVGQQQDIASYTFNNIAPDESETKEVDLSGKSLSNNIEFSLVLLDIDGYRGINPITINFSDKLDFLCELKNLVIKKGAVKMEADDDFVSKADTFALDAGEVEGAKIKLFEAKFLNGELAFDIQSDIQLNGKIVITLPDIKKNGTPLSIEKLLLKQSQTQVHSSPINVADYIFDLTAGKDTCNMIAYEYKVELYGDAEGEYTEFNATDEVQVNLSLTKLKLDYAKGNFGNQTVDLDNDEFEFESDIFNMIDGDFGLTNPKINLIIDNKQVGVNAKINAQFTASKDGESRDIFDLTNPNHNNLFLTSAEFDNPFWFTDTISIDTTNSQIDYFIALPPTNNITYGGQVIFNNGSEPTPENPNFITSESKMIIGMEVDLPLSLQTSNLLIKDTIALDEPEVDGLDEVELVINYTNGLPLSLKMELQFVDTLNQTPIGRIIEVDPIKLPTVVDGKVTEASTGEITITLKDTDIDNLSLANGIAFEAKVSTPEGEVDGEVKPLPGKLYATDKLDLRFGIKTQLDISEL